MSLRCLLGIHLWHYLRNEHGGKSMQRVCERCGKRQGWDHDKARCHGIIEWVDL
jgi:hypothetical protein